jgi:predicted enzyme related to lactoylglutathione lyase
MNSTMRTNRPAWVDLGSPDAAASRDFYSNLFGWTVEVNPDPTYGGYGLAKVNGQDVAGIGPKMDPNQPTVWSLYIGTEDAAALGDKVTANGGTVLMGAFDVGDQGKMAVFQDPAGAVISGWQPGGMGTFLTEQVNTFGWGELNSRDLGKAVPFYQAVFGWGSKGSDVAGEPTYVEFQQGGESILGGQPMNPMVPPQVPSYWGIYFYVEDADAAFQKALGLGATAVVPPMDFPGGRFAIVADPQGAQFGLLRMRS